MQTAEASICWRPCCQAPAVCGALHITGTLEGKIFKFDKQQYAAHLNSCPRAESETAGVPTTEDRGDGSSGRATTHATMQVHSHDSWRHQPAGLEGCC